MKTQIKTLPAFSVALPTFTIDSIYSERCYQEVIWNKDTTQSAGFHSDAEFLVFIQRYLTQAIEVVSTRGEPIASCLAAESVRKIVAMALATAEQNGWVDELASSDYSCDRNLSLMTSLAHLQHLVNEGFSASFLNLPSKLKLCLSQIFWNGAHAMAKNQAFSVVREV